MPIGLHNCEYRVTANRTTENPVVPLKFKRFDHFVINKTRMYGAYNISSELSILINSLEKNRAELGKALPPI